VRRADGSWLLRGDPPDASTLERSPARHARVGDLLRPARRFTRTTNGTPAGAPVAPMRS
jgi:CRP/FNR family cyclic AMP-dependent transcriptional regulator